MTLKMHADQVDIPTSVVADLVASQLPQWRGLPISPVTSHGTVNALFRLGDDVVLRFPLKPSLDEELRADLIAEQEIARRLAPLVPVDVPTPLALGEPGDGYRGPWTAYRWIPGETAGDHNVDDWHDLARELAQFVEVLQRIDTDGRRWDGRGRGGPLADKDEGVRAAFAASTHLTDTVALLAVWERCLEAERADSTDVWIHTDLMPGNLLIRDGRLAAVIDLGAVGIGDPAVDLMPAWCLLPAGARETYRQSLGADDAMWERGRGWAIVQAIHALPYYVESNPVMANTARHTLNAVLD